MSSGSVAQERMRLVMGLTVVGAALLACGVILVLIGSALRLKSPHDGRGFVQAGEAVAVCGLAFGVGLLVVFIMDQADRAGRRGPGKARKGSGPQPASGGLIPLPSPETGPAELRQEPVVELRLASRYPRPDHAGNRWQPDAGTGWYPADARNVSYPHPGSGPDLQAGSSWSPGPAHVWSPQYDWDSSAEAGWSLAEADNWAGDDRGCWGPAGQGGWIHGGQQDQQDWAAAGQGGWDQGGWGPPGQAGWGPGSQHVESEGAGALDDTAPLPVILDAGPPAPKTAEDEPDPAPEPGNAQSAPLSVFDPAPRKPVFDPGPKKVPERDRSSGRDAPAGDSGPGAKADPLPAETQAKLEQIKDLYMTAEAIGEDALVKHFDQLSQRQRFLIREFFDRAGLGSSRTSSLLTGDSADDGKSPPTQDGASLRG